MPDHVHLLLTPLETSPGQWRSLTDVMHSIKGNIGRLVAEHRKRPGAVFQDESFDHIVRNEQDLLETIDYIRTNPLRAGLESSSHYPWVVLETAPGWDASTRAAGIDLKHELWAPRIGERAWYSRIDRVVRKTPAVRSGSKTRSVAGGAEENRPLAGSTLSGEGVSGTPGETRSADAREDAQAPQPPRADAPEQECVERPCACVFIKHTNACGVGVDGDAMEAYRRAYLGDPNAAMGGILACNFPVDAAFAAMVMETYDRLGRPLKEAGAAFAPGGFFVEVWIAPAFSDDAVRIIRGRYDPAEPTASADEPIIQNPPKKKWGENVRLLAVGDMRAAPDPKELQYRSIAGGMLVQSPDILGLNEEQWKVATKRAPTDAEMADLRLAWLVCKHTKSNAISICRDGMLLGSGAGQMSRVMSCRIATWLARENGHSEKLPGSVAASDAFFPFPDGPKILIDAGVSALIQPGGSKRDQETIDLCDQRGVAMIFTGTRHFKH
ncbi:MAG: hypothetical protein HZB38_03240 [Planctomycetes bacterium]|nr:hypothetical protein [Planctomycetota bacterium]